MTERLDVLVARQLKVSREEARRVIEGGHVTLDDRVMDKPGAKLPSELVFTVSGGLRPFVSRGGEKLDKALTCFGISIEGQYCLDIGASTGGFTDCMLKHGAARVCAVENGTAQLAAILAEDPRVVSLEQTDIRTLTLDVLRKRVPDFTGEGFGFAAVDVSFISQTKVLEPVCNLLLPGAALVSLVKPQFEAGPGRVNKHGVVCDEAEQRRAVERVAVYAEGLGLTRMGEVESPVGTENREYLLYFKIRKD